MGNTLTFRAAPAPEGPLGAGWLQPMIYCHRDQAPTGPIRPALRFQQQRQRVAAAREGDNDGRRGSSLQPLVEGAVSDRAHRM